MRVGLVGSKWIIPLLFQRCAQTHQPAELFARSCYSLTMISHGTACGRHFISLRVWSWCWCPNSPTVKQDPRLKRELGVWKLFIRWVEIVGNHLFFFTYLGDATVKGLSFAIGSFTVCGSGDCGPLQPLGGAPRSRVESRLPEAGRILIRWGGYWEYEEEAPAPVCLRHRLVFPPNLPWSGSANCNKVSLAERSKAAGSSPVTQYYGFGGSNPPANKKKFYIRPD